MILSGILASLVRHNNLYIVIGALIAFIFLACKSTTQSFIFFILTLVLYASVTLISNTLIHKLNAETGSIAEALSIPFQQTARYIKCYPDDVTDSEKDAINNVLEYDILADQYDPVLSDNIKRTYHGDSDSLKSYFKVWAIMFFKHPLTYIEATLNNSYTYYCPNGQNSPQGLVITYIENNPAVDKGFFNIHYVFEDYELRSITTNLISFFEHIPGIGLLMHMGIYTWILLILLAYCIYRNCAILFAAFSIPALTVLTCVASPVNGLLRYSLPVIIMTPILVGWVLVVTKKSED